MSSTSNIESARSVFRLLRPRQWVKNAFVLAPLLFSRLFFEGDSILLSILAGAYFSIASSAVYVLNDLRDIEYDRAHPIKARTRPLASGAIRKNTAFAILSALYAMLLSGFVFFPNVMLVIFFYLFLNVAYSYGLKNLPVLDIFIIAIGFVLRVFAGAVAISVPVSNWMFLTTFSLALYLGSVKRREELSRSGSNARGVLSKYSVSLVDRYATTSANASILFYSVFVITSKPDLVLTVPLVIFGIFRFWFAAESRDQGESPTEVLLKDWQLQIGVLLWSSLSFWILATGGE